MTAVPLTVAVPLVVAQPELLPLALVVGGTAYLAWRATHPIDHHVSTFHVPSFPWQRVREVVRGVTLPPPPSGISIPHSSEELGGVGKGGVQLHRPTRIPELSETHRTLTPPAVPAMSDWTDFPAELPHFDFSLLYTNGGAAPTAPLPPAVLPKTVQEALANAQREAAQFGGSERSVDELAAKLDLTDDKLIHATDLQGLRHILDKKVMQGKSGDDFFVGTGNMQTMFGDYAVILPKNLAEQAGTKQFEGGTSLKIPRTKLADGDLRGVIVTNEADIPHVEALLREHGHTDVPVLTHWSANEVFHEARQQGMYESAAKHFQDTKEHYPFYNGGTNDGIDYGG